MKDLIKFSVKQYFFWFLYFITLQFAFLFFFINELENVSANHIAYTFIHGLGLNFASSAYLSSVTILLYFISLSMKSKILQKANLIYIIIALLICLIINTGDFALYQNWGTKINGKALWYLQFSDSTNSTKGDWGFLKYFSAISAISVVFAFLYYKNLRKLHVSKLSLFKSISGFIIIIFILFYAIRGGLSGRPIDRGSSFYSKHPTLNYAAVNGFWNFFDIISNMKSPVKPYNFFNELEIEKIKIELLNNKANAEFKLSNIQKPNIIFIYLESWGADVVGCLGGEKGITPCFDKLSKEGILFKNFYSTGFRTEQGLMATLSGFPAQAQTYPMLDFDRFDNYPNLIKEMSDIGYFTSYYTGGNPHFANTDIYLISAGIDKINKDLLAKAKRKSAWGAMDEESFDHILGGLNKQVQPFFTSMVTITSHEWFEADVQQIFKDKDPVAARYKNTVYYTDSCLYDFINKSRNKDWYKNSLIFIMADHACSYPSHHEMNEPERYHIPLIIAGGALKSEYINSVNYTYSSHLNIPALICDELKIKKDKFPFSENMLADSTNSFAYFAYDHGFGILNKNNEIVWDQNLKKVITIKGNTNDKKILLKKGKFIMQYSAMLKDEFQIKK